MANRFGFEIIFLELRKIINNKTSICTNKNEVVSA